jgi:hypothetical protein
LRLGGPQVRGDSAHGDSWARQVGVLRLRHDAGGVVSAQAAVLHVPPAEQLVDLAFYHEKEPAAFYGGLQLSLLPEKVRC